MDRLAFDGTRFAVFAFTGSGRSDTRTYWKGTGANDTVATTDYTYDSFGRLTETGTWNPTPDTIVHFKRAYDYSGNPKYTQYGHNTARRELYSTQTGASPEGPGDALNRLTRFRRSAETIHRRERQNGRNGQAAHQRG